MRSLRAPLETALPPRARCLRPARPRVTPEMCFSQQRLSFSGGSRFAAWQDAWYWPCASNERLHAARARLDSFGNPALRWTSIQYLPSSQIHH